MRYSLMIVVLVLPPLLAWGVLPLYRWLASPVPLIEETGFGDRRTTGPHP